MIFIFGKRKNARRWLRFGGDSLVANVLYCEFWPKKKMAQVQETVDRLNRDNPKHTFKIGESKW